MQTYYFRFPLFFFSNVYLLLNEIINLKILEIFYENFRIKTRGNKNNRFETTITNETLDHV